MPPNLIWDDLLIQNISEPDACTWLGYWSGMVKGTVTPVFMSKFGDWFLRRPDGGTDELSVIEGTYLPVAATPEEFAFLVNSPGVAGKAFAFFSGISIARARHHSTAGAVLCFCAASGVFWTPRYCTSDAHGHRRMASNLCRAFYFNAIEEMQVKLSLRLSRTRSSRIMSLLRRLGFHSSRTTYMTLLRSYGWLMREVSSGGGAY